MNLFKKFTILSIFLLLSGSVFAVPYSTHWNTTTGDWDIVGNWNNGLPSSDGQTYIDADLSGDGPTIDSSMTATTLKFRGPARNDGDDASLTMTGGTLHTYDVWIMCEYGGTGVVNMSGGTVTCDAILYIPYAGGGTRDADFNLSGGTINTSGFEMNTGGLMDITLAAL